MKVDIWVALVAAHKMLNRHAEPSVEVMRQVNAAQTESELADAEALYNAYFYPITNAVMNEYHDAVVDKAKTLSPKLLDIYERNFFYGDEFTVGDYLSMKAEKQAEATQVAA